MNRRQKLTTMGGCVMASAALLDVVRVWLRLRSLLRRCTCIPGSDPTGCPTHDRQGATAAIMQALDEAENEYNRGWPL